MSRSSAAVTVREARSGDAAVLTEIAHAAKRHWGYPEELIALWREDLSITPASIARDATLIAEIDGTPVGVVAISTWREVPEIEHLWVRPERMGLGIGRHLYTLALERAARAGASTVVVVSDPYAESFYVRMGAVRVGDSPSMPPGRRLPRLLHTLTMPGRDASVDRPPGGRP